MRTTYLKIKVLVSFIAILMFGGFSVFAQESQNDSLYCSNTYKIAFQPPKDFIKSAQSTQERLIFTASKSSFGSNTQLQFEVQELNEADKLSQLLANDEGMEMVAKIFIGQLEAGLVDFEFAVLEKKRIKIGSFNVLKLVTSAVIAQEKVRQVLFVIPVAQHKRIYSFSLQTSENYFDKLLPKVEASVNSFELLKTDNKP